MKKLATWFLQGLVLIAPIAITVFVVFEIVVIVGSFSSRVFKRIGMEEIHPIADPIIGFAAVVAIIVLIGFLSSTFFFRPIFAFLENMFNNTPLIKIIFSAIRDLFSAFMSDKRKFNQAVLVEIGSSGGLQKLGFITSSDLTDLGMKDKVAVYLPHSYNFSGNLFIVSQKRITPLEEVSSTELMKFIVSGGVTEIEENK